jgi:hypothetical protein
MVCPEEMEPVRTDRGLLDVASAVAAGAAVAAAVAADRAERVAAAVLAGVVEAAAAIKWVLAGLFNNPRWVGRRKYRSIPSATMKQTLNRR